MVRLTTSEVLSVWIQRAGNTGRMIDYPPYRASGSQETCHEAIRRGSKAFEEHYGRWLVFYLSATESIALLTTYRHRSRRERSAGTRISRHGSDDNNSILREVTATTTIRRVFHNFLHCIDYEWQQNRSWPLVCLGTFEECTRHHHHEPVTVCESSQDTLRLGPQ